MNALRVDRQLLRAAVSRCSFTSSRSAWFRVAALRLLRVGLFFVLFPFLRLIFVLPIGIGIGIRRRVLCRIVVLTVVLRGLFGFLPRGSATRRTGTVRRILVQAVMRFFQIRQQLRR